MAEEYLLLQTDKSLNREINLYGCNFMCHYVISEQPMDSQRILSYFDKAKKAGFIGDKCYINDNNGLLKLLGSSCKVGSLPATYTRLEYTVLNSTYHHFVVVRNGMVYNPDPSLTLLQCVGIRHYA